MHYSVMVFGENAEEQLAPFQENNMGDCPEEFLSFQDFTDDYTDEYRSKSADFYKKESRTARLASKEGRALLDLRRLFVMMEEAPSVYEDSLNSRPPDEQTRHRKVHTELLAASNVKHDSIYTQADMSAIVGRVDIQLGDLRINSARQDPRVMARFIADGWEIAKIPFREIYRTLEEYVLEELGEERHPVVGGYGYYTNMNSRWDWYELGGRWSGLFTLKDDQGAKNVKQIETPLGKVYVADAAPKRCIDIPKTELVAESKAREDFNLIVKACQLWGGTLPPEFSKWCEEYRGMAPVESHRAKLWGEYLKLPSIDMLARAGWHHNIQAAQKRLDSGVGVAIAKARRQALATNSAIVNDTWESVDERDSYDGWVTYLQGLVDDCSDDTLISIYDCHQ